MRSPKTIWTKQKCKKVAAKYASRTQWAKSAGTSYNIAAECGWLDYCCRHMIPKIKPNGYWTKDRCLTEALKFKSRSDWAKKSGSSYNIARENKWLERCCNHMERKYKPSGYWSKQQCKREARKYSNATEWQRNNAASYAISIDNGWYADCIKHFKPKKMKNGYWTKRNCSIAALKYKSRSEFEKYERGAYHAALDKNWMNDVCAHMISNRKHNGYSMEELQAEAAKYQTRRDFRRSNEKMVLWATRHGLMDQICRHMRVIGNRKRRQLYAFEHPDKTAYVGQAADVVYRREQHLFHKRSDKVGRILRKKLKEFGPSQVWRVFPKWYSEEEIGSAEKALYLKYTKAGWNMLNSTSALGALGGTVRKWTKEACVIEAKRFQSRSQMDQKSKSAYRAILKNGWSDECFNHMGPGKIIKYPDHILIKLTSKVKSHIEFKEKYPNEYRAILKRKNLKAHFKKLLKQRRVYTKALIKSAMSKSKNISDFRQRFPGEYRASKFRKMPFKN